MPRDGWAPSPGGLVRALLPLLRASGGTWVGWTGEADDAPEPFTLDGVNLHPVLVTAEEVQDYYEGFSNDTLWPLYHDALRDSTYSGAHWAAYQTVNQRFADALAEVAPDDAIVWIHDYHLQLVPQMLRDKRPDLVIGFFFHIPFPPVELFMRLPWRTEIAAGLARRATSSASSGRSTRPTSAPCATSCSAGAPQVGSYPISIDVSELEAVAAGRATRQRSNRYRTRLGEPEVVLLGVDRLDYTKGISQRLRAYQSLLDDGTLDVERCVMVQVATPTREGVEHYQVERREIEQLVSEINGVHGRLGYPAIHYLYQSLPLDELVALYRTGDVMLVTPLRDGMNLVAKEYVTTRLDGDGVLVLSEFAGAADELTDAVLVNPHDSGALRDAIVTAVEMNRHDRRARMARLREVVRGSDVQTWADRFLADLIEHGHRVVTAGPGADLPDDVATAAAALARPLLVGLDVDGVLAPIVAHADDAALLPGHARGGQPAGDAGHRRRRVRAHRRRTSSASGSRTTSRCSGCTAWSAAASARSSWPRTSGRGSTASHALAVDAAEQAGDGAWVEVKPASVVLHVREASPDHGARSAADLRARRRRRHRRPRAAGQGRRRAADASDEQGPRRRGAARRARRRRRRVRRRRPHRRGGLRHARPRPAARSASGPARPRRTTASPGRPRSSPSSPPSPTGSTGRPAERSRQDRRGRSCAVA